MPKYYGLIRVLNSYHSSPSCNAVKVAARKYNAEVREYASDRAAAGAGHIHQCNICMSNNVFDVLSHNKRVYLSDEQLSALRAVVHQFDTKGAMTLRAISVLRNRSWISTYIILKKLRKLALTEHKVKLGGRRASHGSIVPTALGIATCKTTPCEKSNMPLD